MKQIYHTITAKSGTGGPGCENIYLCNRTPNGLFEDADGSKYIVVDHLTDNNETIGIAIALTHTDLPSYTWQVLGQEPVGYGRWHGSYRLRLVDALEEECSMGCPGVVSVGDRHASIQCPDVAGECRMISLGYVGNKGFMFRDFDGWMIESVDNRTVFFQTSTKRSTGLVLRPRISPQGNSAISNILKEMLKLGLLEKELKTPKTTKFGYRSKPL